MLSLQTEIATAVAEALKVTLLGDIASKIELGGTRNPAALDAYLRDSKALHSRHDASDISIAIAAYTEAIRLDPNFALAFAGDRKLSPTMPSRGTVKLRCKGLYGASVLGLCRTCAPREQQFQWPDRSQRCEHRE